MAPLLMSNTLFNGLERWQTIYQIQDSYVGRKDMKKVGEVGRGTRVKISKRYGSRAFLAILEESMPCCTDKVGGS